MILHLASFIFTKPNISARGIITAKAEIGVSNKRTVSNTSMGNKMMMRREKKKV